MIRQVFIFLCFISITSCSRLNFIQGEILLSNSEVDYRIISRLVLKEDGTFIYEDQISSMIFKAEGNWEKIGNTIELNSSDKVKTARQFSILYQRKILSIICLLYNEQPCTYNRSIE